MFQSTPGLVTRRNVPVAASGGLYLIVSIHSWSSYQEKRKGAHKVNQAQSVSIHSWSSYQEKRLRGSGFLSLETFQSTPGLVTRRNRQEA